MTILFTELKEKLKQLDEITLMELLNLSSEDLIERFDDIIEERFNLLVEQFSEDEED